MVAVAYEDLDVLLEVHERLDHDAYATREAYWDDVVHELEAGRERLEDAVYGRRERLREAADERADLLLVGSVTVIPLGAGHAAGFALTGDPVFLEGLAALSPFAALPAASVGNAYRKRVNVDRELASRADTYGEALETARTVRDVYRP